MYASYDYYVNDYGGDVIPEKDYPKAARAADAYIDRVTFGRLRQGAAVDREVQFAACAAAEIYHRKAAAAAAHAVGVKSEDVDGYKLTYEDGFALAAQLDAELCAAVDLYLPRSSPLRYAGV